MFFIKIVTGSLYWATGEILVKLAHSGHLTALHPNCAQGHVHIFHSQWILNKKTSHLLSVLHTFQ